MLETSMETSFYPDELYSNSPMKMRSLKKMMTLDLDGPTSVAKRGKFNGLLSSPDLNMLKLGSPELENLLIQQHGQVTTTPTPGQNLFPKTVTEEHELYAKGFVEALAELHQYSETYAPSSPSNSSSTAEELLQWTQQHQHQQQQQMDMCQLAAAAPSHLPPSTSHQSPSHYQISNYTDYMLPVNIKEEPQMVPSTSCSRDTPPLSPIDMMAQERIKLERKRQRNRLAASKCRRRKLERIARLEDKVKQLKDDNVELGTVVAKLKDHICRLKEQLMEHVNSGCQVMAAPNEYLS